jgi:hypothetical protein
LNPATQSGPEGLRLVFGLIVTVQGFEISRYLGAEYDGPTRIRSMRIAQGLSAAIYLGYVLLLSVLFEAGAAASSETAIIALMGLVAPVLPLMLVVAALSAQFSAAIADTGGSGGLVAELTGGRIGPRSAYGLLVAAGLALIWTSDVFQIISHASRAFALYYALQAGVAALTARARGEAGRAAGFGGLAALGLMIAVLGLPVE